MAQMKISFKNIAVYKDDSKGKVVRIANRYTTVLEKAVFNFVALNLDMSEISIDTRVVHHKTSTDFFLTIIDTADELHFSLNGENVTQQDIAIRLYECFFKQVLGDDAVMEVL